MKLNQLEYFCAASRYRSITEASKKLFVTQPAISNAIRELEREFCVNLFTRSKNQFTLNREGEIFYKKAEDLLKYSKTISSQLYDLGKSHNVLRIGIPPMLSTVFLPDLLFAFNDRHPEIEIELFEYGSMRAASLVHDESLELAIVNMNLYNLDKFNSQIIAADRFVFCVTAEHHLAGEKSIGLESLAKEPLIMFNTDSVQNQTLKAEFEARGIKPKIILHTSQILTVKSFITKQLGGAFFYTCMMKKHPELIGLPITPFIEQEIGIIWRKEKYVSNNAEKFIIFTTEYLKDKIGFPRNE